MVARTGGLMALRGGLPAGAPGSARLAGGGWLVAARACPRAASACATPALGNSEGTCSALLLFGPSSATSTGDRDQALLLGFLPGLLRPEVWPFLGLYGLWLWFAEPALRRLIVVLAALIPLLWFLPEADRLRRRLPRRRARQDPGARLARAALSPHPVRC